MAQRADATESVNRQFCEILKGKIEREDKTPICLDCKPWEGNVELIVLCPVHVPKTDRQAKDFARKVIVEKIDNEGKYVHDAVYEMTGKQLLEYLAYAYKGGVK